MSGPTITINADGTWTPTSGQTINPGGVVRFVFAADVPNGSSAVIAFQSPIHITPPVIGTGGGTIKVGS